MRDRQSTADALPLEQVKSPAPRSLRGLTRLFRARGEGGIGLIELAVAIALFGVLSGAAYQTIIGTQNAEVANTNELAALSQAQNGIDTLAGQLREAASPPSGAPAVAQAAGNSITFYSYLGAGCSTYPCPPPSEVAVTLVSAAGGYVLQEQITAPGSDESYGGQPSTRVLANEVVDSSNLFTYYAPGEEPSQGSSGTPIALPATSPSVVEVSIDLAVRHTASGSPVTLSTSVALENVIMQTAPALTTTPTTTSS